MFSTSPQFDDGQAMAQYQVSGSQAFALGHYPGDPVFPGVMSLYLMQTLAEAQASEIAGTPRKASGIKRVSFLSLIRPGDTAEIRCDPPKTASDGQTVIRSHLTVQGTVCAKSEILFTAA